MSFYSTWFSGWFPSDWGLFEIR